MALDRTSAARAGLALVSDVGLDSLTVRRLAGELGVRAPALYWHFTDKRALLDEMTQLLLAPVVAGLQPTPGPADQVWEWLEHALVAVHEALGAQRDGARIAISAGIMSTPALGTLLERVVGALHVAGFGLADATRLAGLALQLVVGRTAEEQTRPEPDAELAIVNSDEFPYPLLAAGLRERHTAGASVADDFRYGVRVLIAGIRATAPTLNCAAATTPPPATPPPR
ncbi:TetR family transcriptional regulator [Pseudonocardia sp. GCM10023141]|uniref:TetR family transcriptional regulator n=1 Tax=Pseudonocardia sp. GCM10023141 TaxID=3252653 RepID=UPI00360C38DE